MSANIEFLLAIGVMMDEKASKRMIILPLSIKSLTLRQKVNIRGYGKKDN